MVPTAKEILYSRTFPGLFQDKITIFEDKVYKTINQDMCEKAYNIYSMYNRLLKFLWYSLLLTHSNCPIHALLFKF